MKGKYIFGAIGVLFTLGLMVLMFTALPASADPTPTVTASITPTPTPTTLYSLTTNSTALGYVSSPGEGTFYYPYGTYIYPLQASNAPCCCEFAYWSGDYNFTWPQIMAQEIWMYDNYSVTANFRPWAVGDLTCCVGGYDSIWLSWTPNYRCCDCYTLDIRYSTSPINDSNWDTATQCTGENLSCSGGPSTEWFEVTGLEEDTTYYFRMKASLDYEDMWSRLSNEASCTTGPPACWGPITPTISPTLTPTISPTVTPSVSPTPTCELKIDQNIYNDDFGFVTDPGCGTFYYPCGTWVYIETYSGMCCGHFDLFYDNDTGGWSIGDVYMDRDYYLTAIFRPYHGVFYPECTGCCNDSIQLSWLSDFCCEGTWDIRYSTSPINDSNWDTATQCIGEPSPQEFNYFCVGGLEPGTTYYFRMKMLSEGMYSYLSDEISCTTMTGCSPTPSVSPSVTPSVSPSISPTVTPSVSPTPSPTPTPGPGDVNGDFKINACDITQCELCILQPETYPKENYPGWDANEDGLGPNSGDVIAVELRILELWPP